MLDLNRKHPKFSYLLTVLVLILQFSLLGELIFGKSILSRLLELTGLDDMLGSRFMAIVLAVLVICCLLSLISIKNLLLKVITLTLISINFIWCAYWLYKAILFERSIKNVPWP